MFGFLIFAAIAIYIYFYYVNVRRYPKGPFPLPFIGNLYHVRPHNLHKYLYETGEKYGHCYTLFLPHPHVVLTDYAHIKDALVTQGDAFIGRSHAPPETYFQRRKQVGVLFSDGDVWSTQRRTSLRIFRNFGMGKSLMEEQVRRSVHEMLEQVHSECKGKSDMDINLPIQLCVANIINETLFGYHFKYDDTAKFRYFVNIANTHLTLIRENLCTLLLQAFPWMENFPIIGREGKGKIVENMSKYHDFIEDEIAVVKKNWNPDSEPTNFVEAYMQEMKGQDGLDMANLEALATDFWMAGMETTGTTLRWGMMFLLTHPHIMVKMREEIDRVIGHDRLPEMTDKASMPYFTAVLHEMQRRANIVAFLGIHRCTEERVVMGKTIPVNSFLLPQVHSVLEHDPMFENPQEFRPERFLEADGKTINKKQVDRMIAFGMGKRQCVGEGLARMELFIILAALLQHFTFEKTHQLDLEPSFGAVLSPKPYTCKITSRGFYQPA